jgi:predicted nucleic acid-binding protein
LRIYLDSSALVKRYLQEDGSDVVDKFFERAERREDQLLFSAWNIGEVLGVFDFRFTRGELDRKQLITAVKLFAGEARKLSALKALKVIPITRTVLHEARELMLRLHIYQADAIQLSTARWMNAGLFVSADRELIQKAGLLQLRVINPEEG